VDLTDHDALRYWAQAAAQLPAGGGSMTRRPGFPARLPARPRRARAQPQAPRPRRRARPPAGPRFAGRARAHGAEARRAGRDDARVLAAMNAVERHRFVDSALVNQAYEDTSLPIGLGRRSPSPAWSRA
jgi:protein-L-isoaspartate(D-aspartate) O-methyltransferase